MTRLTIPEDQLMELKKSTAAQDIIAWMGVVLYLNPNRARHVHIPYRRSSLRAPAMSTIAPLMNFPNAAMSVTTDVKWDANMEEDEIFWLSLFDAPLVRIRNGIQLLLFPLASYTSKIW